MKNFYKEFISYMSGLIEDDPIPYEIKSLVFYINSHNEIGFSATEKEEVKTVDLFFYFPLEAEFFYCPKLTEIMVKNTKIKNLEILKLLLVNLKKDDYFKKFNIFYGYLFEKAHKIKI